MTVQNIIATRVTVSKQIKDSKEGADDYLFGCTVTTCF